MKTRIAVLFALFAIILAACSSHPLEAPLPPAYVSPVPDNWSQAQVQKLQKNLITSSRIKSLTTGSATSKARLPSLSI